MGGLIFLFLIAVLIVILITPAIRARLNKDAPPRPPGEESPHEVVIRRLDDHRSRRNRPTDDSIPRE
jgi:hypothetical protein